MKKAVPQTSDFRSYLQSELVRRCKANPAYSLRSFAKYLEIEPSALSKILKGKRRLSPRTFDKLAGRMALSPSERSRFAPQGKLRRGTLYRGRVPAVSEYRRISLEQFDEISDWYHFAILELTYTRDFMPDAKWVARRLAITPSEVNIAVERLTRMGFLEIDESGNWHDLSGSVTSARPGRTSVALRNLQRQALEKSLAALSEIPIQDRDHSSICMAIDPAKLPLARERIKEFRRELCEILKGEGPPRDAVYQLQISLYPLTR